MKHLLAIFLAALCATAPAQTIRTLGYNSTNGIIVAATNVTWSNAFSFTTNSVAEQTRANLGFSTNLNTLWTATNAADARSAAGLPLSALTNTSNVTAMRQLAGSTNSSHPFSGTFAFTNPDNNLTYAAVVSNGIILEIYEY